MAAKLKIKIACDPFESVRALEDKRVEPDGVELDFQPEMSNPVRHGRMARDLAFDVCELSVSTYLIARDQGVPIVAIPVFLFRKFRHGNIFVNPKSGVRTPQDLVGKRIGCPTLQPPSNVWIHGILDDEGALPHRSVTWVVERDEDIPFKPPADLRIERARRGANIVDMLMAGELDAVSAPQTPQPLVDGDPRIGRLFPDYVARERAWFEKTGLFPIMHVTALPKALVDREPWIIKSLIEAFERSKQAAYKHFANTRVATLAWFGAQWEDERRLFGEDAWPYGLGETNRRNLETVIRYTHAQGLTSRAASLDELFVRP